MMESLTKSRDFETDQGDIRPQSIQRIRPFAPLTPQEKWQIFVARPAVRMVVVLILCVAVGGYIFGTRTRASTPAKFPISTSSNFESATSTTLKTQRIKVYVSGAVKNPGVIELDSTSRVNDAISATGGVNADADLSKCNLAAFLVDGSSIQIPTKPTSDTPNCGGMTSPSNIAGINGETATGVGGKINLNTASQTEIETLPGIGPTMGAAIIAYRLEHGSFTSINELRKVKGIGDKRFADLKDLVST